MFFCEPPVRQPKKKTIATVCETQNTSLYMLEESPTYGLRRRIILNNNSNTQHLTKTAAFRIAEAQYEQFLDLLKSIPGADAGILYREIFARGLKSLSAFYNKKGVVAIDSSEEEKGA